MGNEFIKLDDDKLTKAYLKGKKLECILGVIFLIPAVLSVLSFMLDIVDIDVNLDTGMLKNFIRMKNCDGIWAGTEGSRDTVIYFGLMAIAGSYLIKDSGMFLFLKSKKEKEDEYKANENQTQN